MLPTLDLHGYDREYARIAIDEFIYDNYKTKNQKVIIIHGNGTGIIKKVTGEVLKRNKYVEEYKIDIQRINKTTYQFYLSSKV